MFQTHTLAWNVVVGKLALIVCLYWQYNIVSPFLICLHITYIQRRKASTYFTYASSLELNPFGVQQMITLKQTHSENGSVTRTRPQEIMVKSHPHSPTPLSVSSAERNKKEKRNQETFSDSGSIMVTAASPLSLLEGDGGYFYPCAIQATSFFHLGTPISLLCCECEKLIRNNARCKPLLRTQKCARHSSTAIENYHPGDPRFGNQTAEKVFLTSQQRRL